MTNYKPITEVSRNLRKRYEAYITGEIVPVLDCGMPALLKNKLIPRAELAVLHGLSGSGKSTFAFQYLLGIAIRLYLEGQGGCVVVNSLEMTDEKLTERMAAILSGVDVSAWLNGTMLKEDYEKLLTWLDFVDALPIFIDDTSFITTGQMSNHLEELHHSEFGPVVLLVSDYGELFADDAGSEEQRVNGIFRNQFYMTREYGCTVLAISQSTNNRADTGRTYIAGPDGTRYSKGILQAADTLIEMWNPPQILDSGRMLDSKAIQAAGYSEHNAYLFVQKFRGSSIGNKGIPLGWLPFRTTFFDLSISQTAGNETIFTHLQDAVNKFKGL